MLSEPGRLCLLGATLVVIGSVTVVIAQVQMGRAWRVGVREGDAPVFVRHGLFRFSRNPIFAGMMLVGLGVAVSAEVWWCWGGLILFVASVPTAGPYRGGSPICELR